MGITVLEIKAYYAQNLLMENDVIKIIRRGASICAERVDNFRGYIVRKYVNLRASHIDKKL